MRNFIELGFPHNTLLYLQAMMKGCLARLLSNSGRNKRQKFSKDDTSKSSLTDESISVFLDDPL